MTSAKDLELEKLTRTKLIEEAKNYEGITGASGMKKDELLEAIKAERSKLGDEEPSASEKSAPAKAVKRKGKGPSREELKTLLGDLKSKRQAALEAGDSVLLKRVRTRYKKINRQLKRTVPAKA